MDSKSLDDIQKFYDEYVKDIDNACTLDDVIKLSITAE